jgi:hypothetical protein
MECFGHSGRNGTKLTTLVGRGQMIIMVLLDDIDNELLSIKYFKKPYKLKIFTIYELNLKVNNEIFYEK